ncbi:MAG: hypothetical protein JWM16_5039, partial [Verrucomicrobiales bacterium]|nr:hypothetical protein [Verrucomicrobiales bacterium]
VAHLAKTKQAAQLFGLATALALHNKALDSAHTNLMTLLALNQAFQQDRLLITEMVQIAIEHIGAGATWEALQTPGWSDAQLKQIEDKWLSLKFIEPMEDSLAMERAIRAGSLDELRHSSKKFSDMMNSWAMLAGSAPTGSSTSNMMDLLEGVPGAIKARSTHALWHYFWSYEDQLRCLQIAQAHLETLRQGNLSWKSADLLVENKLKATGIKAAANTAEDYEFLDPKILGARTFFSDQTLNNKNGIRRALTGETLKEIVSTAIALKRYQIRNGKNPASLSQLVPDYLPTMPTDRMDGQTLRYRLEPDGAFTLYSVGTDLVDQGGVAPANPDTQPLRSWTMQPDWVWPTLASPKEIEEFEAQQAEKNNKKALRRRPNPKPASTNTIQPTAPAP